MIVEHCSNGPGPVYERASENGRMLPDELHCLDSWVVDDGRLDRCFQLMETDDASLFDEWTENWADLAPFEIFPVIGSGDAATRAGTVPR